MSNNRNGKQDEFAALDAVDLATATEDKVCITRDHTTGSMAWRFATPQADPIGLMVRAMVYDLILNSDLAKKVAQLEARVAELEAKDGS
jgi:hypothetical protein